MRQILFRGKSVATGEWVCGHYLTFMFEVHGGDHPVDELGHFIFPVKPDSMQREEDEYVEVFAETVGQSLELKEKGGRTVFEGDILQDDYGRIWHIVFDDYSLSFYFELQAKPKKFDGRIGPMRTRVQKYLLEMMQLIGESANHPHLLT